MATKQIYEVENNLLSQESNNYMASNMGLWDYKDESGTNLSMFFKNWDIPEYINGEKSYRIKESDLNRLDNIAYKAYGNPEYYWVIALVNGITNPFDMKVEQIIRLLPKSYIDNNMFIYYNNEKELF